MKHYSKAKLEKHPHLKGQDLDIIRHACEKFRDLPVKVVNYLEGTAGHHEYPHARARARAVAGRLPERRGLSPVGAAMGQ